MPAERNIHDLDATIRHLSGIYPPSKSDHDIRRMTTRQIEESVINMTWALRHFETLLQILDRVEFKHDDKPKTEQIAALVVQRIGWTLDVLGDLKPAN